MNKFWFGVFAAVIALPVISVCLMVALTYLSSPELPFTWDGFFSLVAIGIAFAFVAALVDGASQ